jgi:hypothetical protein
VAPPDESLGTRDDAATEPDHGLVLEPELPAGDPVLQVGEQVFVGGGALSRHS